MTTVWETLKKGPDGLVPVITVDEESKAVLMLAYMNEEALLATERTGFMHYYSRSRKTLWKKGETSLHVQEVVDAFVDCDEDTLLFTVKQTGAACHTGNKTCFYRRLEDKE